MSHSQYVPFFLGFWNLQSFFDFKENSGRSPTSPSHQRKLSNLERTPPPRGFEDFFANVAADPLVQVPSLVDGNISHEM